MCPRRKEKGGTCLVRRVVRVSLSFMNEEDLAGNILLDSLTLTASVINQSIPRIEVVGYIGRNNLLARESSKD